MPQRLCAWQGFPTGMLITVKLNKNPLLCVNILNIVQNINRFMQQIKNEAAVMKKLHHKNICKFHKFFFGKGSKRAILVMEIAEGQVLSEFVKDSHLLEVDNVRKITQGIMRALAYMHARHITHRDIKPGWTNKQGELQLLCLSVVCSHNCLLNYLCVCGHTCR